MVCLHLQSKIREGQRPVADVPALLHAVCNQAGETEGGREACLLALDLGREGGREGGKKE